MAHPKLMLGSERPEPPALQRQREAMQRLAQPESLQLLPEEAPSGDLPVTPSLPPNQQGGAPADEEPALEGLLEKWMRRQRAEKVTIIRPGLTVSVSVLFLHDDELRVYFAFDPKLVDFDAGAESTMVVELAFEDRLELAFGGQRCAVLYAGGLFRLPGLPFAVISFFKVNPN